MAIVFISPKQRQRMFFTGITILFLLFLLVVSFGVFLSKPKPAPNQIVLNKPKIDINLQVLESEQVKILEPAAQMDLQFKYAAITDKGSKTSGIITAVSETEARKILLGMQMTGIVLEEAKIGRENPFTPYYQPSVAPALNTKTK